MYLPSDLVATIRTWPVESQRRARRNAMTASTALAQLRAEREDVEGYLAELADLADLANLAQPSAVAPADLTIPVPRVAAGG